MKNGLFSELLTPPSEFTPMPFWFFNDTYDRKLVREKLEDYCKKGVEGFVLHPRIGIPKEMEYLSEAYFQAVEEIVSIAAELGMRVVLYDEGMYPSGSAHGKVVEKNPDFASWGILLREEPVGKQILCRMENGQYLVADHTGGNIRGIHFGEDDGEAGAPPSADILNPDAVDTFIELTHEAHYQRLKPYFGSTIIAFFTDEPCVMGRNSGQFKSWTPGLEIELEKRGGKQTDLGQLFTKKGFGGIYGIDASNAGAVCGQEEEENETVRIYRDLIRERLTSVFYTKLSSWCENHGIAFMGHPETSDDMDEEMFFHIPGQDLIMRRVSYETGGLLEFDSVQAKCSADMARLMGRRRNANECFGVCSRKDDPWHLPASDLKWFTDWLAIRGVNLFVPHAFYYSIEGKRSGERPPDVGPNNIWWKHYRIFSDYMKRLSYVMTDNESTAKLAVLVKSNALPYKEVAWLYEHQIEFVYVPVSLPVKAEDGCLHCGPLSFPLVWNLAGAEYEDLLEGIRKLDPEGSRGFKPEACYSYASVELSEENKGLRAAHIRKKGAELFLLSQETGEGFEGRILLKDLKDCKEKSRYQVYEMDLFTGEGGQVTDTRKEEKGISFSMRLSEGETRLYLVFDAGNEELKKDLSDCRQTVCPGKKHSLSLSDRYAKKDGLGDLTDRFTLVREEKNTKEYECCLTKEELIGKTEAWFSVRGEEMAECYADGELRDISFGMPHRLRLKKIDTEKNQMIRLVMTGSAANLHGCHKLPFGLE